MVSNRLKVKVVTLGNSGVGKTSIILRMDGHAFVPKIDVSVGASFIIVRSKHNERDVMLEIWDTAGQERFRSIIPAYSRNARVAMLVYDITSLDSYNEIPALLRTLQRGPSSDTLQLFFLIANKVDLQHARVVSREMGEKLANEIGAVYFETSAKDGTEIHNVVSKITELAVQTFGKEDPGLQNLILKEDPNPEKKKRSCCNT